MNAGEKPIREYNAIIKLLPLKPSKNDPPLKVECKILKVRGQKK